MATQRHIYFGIDLGTTNSCIAYGIIDPRTNSIRPQILDISQRNIIMGMEQRKLLPSAVFFDEKGPVVGVFAKDRMKTQPSRVIMSVKNYMGTNQHFIIDKKNYNPPQISALILKHLKKEVERKLNIELKDVVIGVPASFDQDMRAATIQAAEMAGFIVKNEDSTLRDILIDEPRAALYYFVYLLSKGEIIAPELDFSKTNTVLVFDLGGGTLDVSIHKIKSARSELTIEDIAISRYTQLGGDVFDKVVASYFFKLFVDKYKIDVNKLSKLDKYEIEQKLVVAAEKVKIEMTTDITNQLWMSEKTITDFDDSSYEIAPGFIIDSKIFFTNLTKRQYDELISDLLAWDLTIADVDRFESFDVDETNNIIYPILDVLYKSKKKLGKLPKIDMILLNGGMTRVHTIKQRLKAFFGIEPYEGLDPDRSVALGACIHHYNISRGKKLTPILAETVGLGLTKQKVKHLVMAGTALPYIGRWQSYKISKAGAKKLRIPLYIGERKDTSPPNRKLVERVFTFPEPCKKDEPVKARIKIDRNKTVTFEYFLERNKDKVYVCEANAIDNVRAKISDTVSVFNKEMSKVTGLVKNLNVNSITNKASAVQVNSSANYNNRSGVGVSSHTNNTDLISKNLEIDGTLKKFLLACNNNNEKLAKKISDEILKASNYDQFILPIGSLLKKRQNRLTLKRVYILLGKLLKKSGDYKKYKNYVKRIADVLYQVEKRDRNLLHVVIKHAIIAIGRIGASEYVDLILEVAEEVGNDPVCSDILIALGKIGQTKSVVEYATSKLIDRGASLPIRMSAAWCLGKIGSRSRDVVLPIKYFKLSIDFLIRNLSNSRYNMTATAQFAYALGEIGDRREGENIITDLEAEKIKNALYKIIGKDGTDYSTDLIKLQRIDKRMAMIALSMVEGATLTAEEVALLDEIRSND